MRGASRLGIVVVVAMVVAIVPIPSGAATDLPSDVQAVMRKTYGSPDVETRYLDGAVDLNGDGKPELVVHVVGPMACGTGGCPTLVFTPTTSGYRLVSTITVTNTPIGVSTTRSAGWRNLIVRVGGGGTSERDVALSFNGSSYPENPTVPSARVQTMSGQKAQVVIHELASFAETKALPSSGTTHAAAFAPSEAPAAEQEDAAPTATKAVPAVRAPEPTAAKIAPAARPPEPTAAKAAPAARAEAPPPDGPGSGPSFDCAQATLPVEKLICGNDGLAALDRALAAAYATAMGKWRDDVKASARADQRQWIAKRNDCAKSRDVASCVHVSYQRRVVEMRISGGDLVASTPVAYVCKGHEDRPFSAVFYGETDPPSALLSFGDRRAVVLTVRAASGAHYTSESVDFWEHHGEATVTWTGVKSVCEAKKRAAHQ